MRLIVFFCMVMLFCQSPQKKDGKKFFLLTIEELKENKEHVRNLEFVKKAQGETIELILESQPGTGYSWKEVENKSPLSLVEDGKIESKENIPGGVSNTLFTYQIRQFGEGEIIFLYRQHWQKEDLHEKKLVVKVKVSP